MGLLEIVNSIGTTVGAPNLEQVRTAYESTPFTLFSRVFSLQNLRAFKFQGLTTETQVNTLNLC